MERRDRLSRVAEVAIWPVGRESRAKEAKGERLKDLKKNTVTNKAHPAKPLSVLT